MSADPELDCRGMRIATMTPSSNTRAGDTRKLITRRRLLLRTFAALITGGFAVYADKIEPDNLEIARTDIHLPHWHASANGITIGLISDFHADYQHAVERVHQASALLADAKPDIVLLGGDYVSSHFTRRYLKPTIQCFGQLSGAPLGAFAIMGNHDCWGNNVGIATRLLSAEGFQVLNNRAVPIPTVPNGYIVGVGDPWCKQMDLKKSLRGVPPDANKILAMHEPDFADTIGTGFDLQLSGHSHGGQIRIPGLPLIHGPKYGRKYPEGLQQAENHLVYTTRGVGMIGPQIRAFCDPEVTILTLRTGHAG